MQPLPLALVLASCAAPKNSGESGAVDTAVRCPVGGSPVGFDVGDCAPDFTLPDRTGAMVSLSDQRGKVALVDISAVW